MKRIHKALLATSLLALSPHAFAYLDPGTGSMIIQGAIAAIAIAGATMKLYWHRLLTTFGIREKEEAEQLSEEDEHCG